VLISRKNRKSILRYSHNETEKLGGYEKMLVVSRKEAATLQDRLDELKRTQQRTAEENKKKWEDVRAKTAVSISSFLLAKLNVPTKRYCTYSILNPGLLLDGTSIRDRASIS
jgi:hypothetical protein